MMRRLMVFGLILAVISITPASVYICGSVTAPEIIFQLNGSQELDLEVDCAPATSILYSSMTFSNFVQSGFFMTIALASFLFFRQFFSVDNGLNQKHGRIIAPLTPPPNFL